MFILKHFRIKKYQILRNVRYIQTKSIKNILDLKEHELSDSEVRIIGWVKSFRDQKEIKFIHLNDGTDGRNLQLVCLAENFPNKDNFSNISNSISFNTSLEVHGKVVKSTHKLQNYDLQVTELKIIGPCNPLEYPFKQKIKQTLESIRPHIHLRSHVDQFADIMKFRSELVSSIHNFFYQNNFTQVHTPIITSNNCEGGCETFQVTLNDYDRGLEIIKKDSINQMDELNSRHFFSKPVYLTASAQLHLETMTTSLGNVYTLSPTFRAEKSMTRHHLAEFYMLEAEMIDMNSLDQILDLTENFLKQVSLKTYDVFDKNLLHLILNKNKPKTSGLEYIEKITNTFNSKKFVRITYQEALDILNKLLNTKKYSKLIKKKIEFGEDMNKEQEKLLVEYFQDTPVFVTKYPKSIKPFYMRQSEDNEKLVENFDLLAPHVGEIIGGSLREHRIDLLNDAIKNQDLEPQVFDLYLETKKFGAMRMGGWGLGLERFMQFLINIENIRDVSSFPRSLYNCKM
ncbi:unnamed protein product [Brachionus calyciflorus]|uniref:asparagine--tRNA ligase n=2 Tax=Brachionus calyciflorus TaxID=104777 RepID=A0A813USH7_9BILA|nr:unnamed protein product [Brachionus calyciflorus]